MDVDLPKQQSPQSLVLRLVLSPEQSTDWSVNGNVTFHEVLDVLDGFMQVSGHDKPTAFEYLDEENDRITVRSDDEVRAMLQWHAWNIHETGSTEPLLVYPRTGRTSSKRNNLGLTVEIAGGTAGSPPVQQGSGSGGSTGRKQPEDIGMILNSGQMYQGDLQLLSIIGQGNGGTVHRAFHIPTQKTVAMKIIPLDISEEYQKQILSELSILFTCHSELIIAFHGAFFTENKISIVTEYMDGGSLDRFHRIPQNVLGRVAVAVVKGLRYLWDLKIIHRDVKPNNVLVNTRGEVKLCDFGVSIQLVNSIAKTYVGTNAYMAPERILGDEYGIHSDVWSLGLSLVEMATGVFPYPATTTTTAEPPPPREPISPFELLQCIVNESPPRLSADVFADALRHFVEICLVKNPKSRPTPEQLTRHPFILQNDTSNQKIIISEFVCAFLRLS